MSSNPTPWGSRYDSLKETTIIMDEIRNELATALNEIGTLRDRLDVYSDNHFPFLSYNTTSLAAALVGLLRGQYSARGEKFPTERVEAAILHESRVWQRGIFDELNGSGEG